METPSADRPVPPIVRVRMRLDGQLRLHPMGPAEPGPAVVQLCDALGRAVYQDDDGKWAVDSEQDADLVRRVADLLAEQAKDDLRGIE